MSKHHIISFNKAFIHLKQRKQNNSAVILAQARESRLGQGVISLRRAALAWARPHTMGNPKI